MEILHWMLIKNPWQLWEQEEEGDQAVDQASQAGVIN